MTHPTPTKEGFYWARLDNPTGYEGESELWAPRLWAPVCVLDGDPTESGNTVPRFTVCVIGYEIDQFLDNFTWGPTIPDLPETAQPK